MFDAPQAFVTSLSAITGTSEQEDGKNTSSLDQTESQRPLGANVPPLGLTNKPLYDLSQTITYARINIYCPSVSHGL